MTRPAAIVLRRPGTNCDEETADAWERAGAGRDLARRPPARGARRARRVPDPDAPRRLLLRRRPRRRADPRDPARHRARRRPAAVPRPRRADPRDLQRVSGARPRRPPARAAHGALGTPHGDPDQQRLGPFRVALGPPGRHAGALAVRDRRRADRAARAPRRGEVRRRRRRRAGRPRSRRAGRLPVRRRIRPARRRAIRPTPTGRRAPWPASATRPAASSA